MHVVVTAMRVIITADIPRKNGQQERPQLPFGPIGAAENILFEHISKEALSQVLCVMM
jgi:hypothetical protein